MPETTDSPTAAAAADGSSHDDSVAAASDRSADESGLLDQSANGGGTNEDHDPYYPPVISLPPEVAIDSGEGQEEVLFKMRAKLYRYDSKSDPAEWKERGTGDVKILKHNDTGNIRLLMRRDKTLKPCANHTVQPWMQLKPNCGSDRAFVWSVQADFADGESKAELLGIRFANAENAQKFNAQFEDAVKQMTRKEARELKEATDTDDVLSKKMEKVDLKKGEEEK